jgi:NAD(P)H-hydrate epimerase
METTETPWHYLSPGILKEKVRPREKFSHKGTYGHALLIAGSHSKMGACLMGTKACLRTGVGLVTAHVPQKGYLPVQTAIPEAMLSLDKDEHHFSSVPSLDAFDAIGIGPGIGKEPESQAAFFELLERAKKPLVIDADGINIISANKDWYEKIPEGSVLTPHPGEFGRLVGKFSDDYARNKKQMEFAGKYGVYLVLKGAHTAVATPSGHCYFNLTGNPGMATGGSGDALTGMILSLLAQKYPPLDASLLAVYLHGLAGDLAACQKGGQGLIATDVIENIPYAYKQLIES